MAVGGGDTVVATTGGVVVSVVHSLCGQRDGVGRKCDAWRRPVLVACWTA